MDLNINYYYVLGIDSMSTMKEIKKSYYKLSLKHHPDKGGDVSTFNSISESYTILIDKGSRLKYDKGSRFGSEYDESLEFLDYDPSKNWNDSAYQDLIKNDLLNITVYVKPNFNGKVEYERWVLCKKCGGNGKDLDSKIVIRDQTGKIIRTFDGDDGCDFCEGSGKDWKGNDCSYCFGKGKIGVTNCKTCDGNKRILGKQKLTGIKIPVNENNVKVESMGNTSKDIPGKCGHLYVVIK